MSKGSNRRPTDEDKFKANFDLIFRKPKPVELTHVVEVGETKCFVTEDMAKGLNGDLPGQHKWKVDAV